MKKTILLSGMLFLCALANGQITTQIEAPPPQQQPPPPTTFDDAIKGTGLNQHSYLGSGWIYGTTTTTFHNSTFSASRMAGAYLTFTFEGSRFEWFTEKKNTHGIVALSIDGGAETFIDLYSSTEQHIIVYTSPLLTEGPAVYHTVKIRVTGTKNPASSNFYGIHDAFNVIYGLRATDNTNTSVGELALGDVVTGLSQYNSAFGYDALGRATNSNRNTVIGASALRSADRSSDNTVVGYNAMGIGGAVEATGNTAVGSGSLHNLVGDYNTAVGTLSGPNHDIYYVNTTALGFLAQTTASNQVRIGNSDVTSIGGQVSWSTLSDGRFKKDLREDVSGLDFINGLRPVSYMVDKTSVQRFLGIPDSIGQSRFAAKEKPVRQTGFVAQEVEKLVQKSGYVFNGVDLPKNDKDPYTIRYAEFVVPLVKAVQEMSVKLDEQQQQIAELLAQIAKNEEGSPTSKTEIQLFQNNPNPFSTDTEIKMVLPETTASARVIVYNLEGKQLKELSVKERGGAGVTIMGNELSAGMYIYALIADGKVVATKRMILTK